MLRVWTVSGKELVAVPVEELGEVRTLKLLLRDLCDYPLCLLQLLHEGVVLEDAARLGCSMDVQLVLLPWHGTTMQHRLAEEFCEACVSGEEKIVRTVLKTGFGITCGGLSSEDRELYDPFRLACGQGHREIVRLLMSYHPEDWSAEGGLKDASGNGHEEVVRLLLEADANLPSGLSMSREEYFWAVVRASNRGHSEIVALLLEALPGVAARDPQGSLRWHLGWVQYHELALMMSCRRGFAEVARLLLQAHSTADSRAAALRQAARKRNVEVVRLLLTAGVGREVRERILYKAAKRGHAEIASIVVDAGVTAEGCAAALLKAAGRGHLEVVRVLSKAGITRLQYLDSALFRASGRGHDEVELLLRIARTRRKARGGTLAKGLLRKRREAQRENWSRRRLSKARASCSGLVKEKLKNHGEVLRDRGYHVYDQGQFTVQESQFQRFRPGHSGWHPRVPCDALIEVFGHVYGLNDAPSAWYKTLDGALLEVGFERSRLDRCLYFMREGRQLTGTVGIHVDDSVTGGQVQNYERALSLLKEKFEFRTWRVRDGDFCGARYTQSEATGEITMTQESFVQKVRPLHLSPPSAEDILQLRHSGAFDRFCKVSYRVHYLHIG
ncbi:Ankyrin repeat and KH domain-containing protein 1 [Symbiodinium microadriaticum]|uniref:Ankyrin repeat and KH domain-containing protein 1 n=1 Tax=Symbiodinium microadriaticum TaxID=2951 RepID=A0A1Q9DI27_SYMMI|nr:Ankyrin repeat and KH domain-containing protein 1 [Symbiodinium microadriaticum]